MTKKQNGEHANKIINEHGDITNDLTEINKIIRGYYEQLIVLQQIRQPRWNGKILRNAWTIKTDLRRNRIVDK